jgi:hypothetical protein
LLKDYIDNKNGIYANFLADKYVSVLDSLSPEELREYILSEEIKENFYIESQVNELSKRNYI